MSLSREVGGAEGGRGRGRGRGVLCDAFDNLFAVGVFVRSQSVIVSDV